ncbi:MAG TPA: HEXXH motif-containing putative peptide modification protein [Methyloceanibacter sp.]|jgi:hypothetical protein|nr:HEXXH motif-containing putative peptide modification protein [Methyloceanibacter sp.]
MQALDREAHGPDMDLFAFHPNGTRAQAVASRVRAGLADSLAVSLRALGEERALAGEDLVARLRSGPIAPRVFGGYTELVEAIFADNIDTAHIIAEELCAADFGRVGPLRIVTLTERHLGRDQPARYRRLIDDDEQLALEIEALGPDEFAAASRRVEQAIGLLDAGAPDIAEELRALVHEIVLVDKDGDRYFGASSFQLWGALFLKLNATASRVEIAEQLAHECAHALLFGLGMGEPLVDNEPEELYPSPLRSDPRPMDGVVHATYVIARMHYTLARLVQSGLLTEEETHEARQRIARNALGYNEGAAVIDGDARWTEAGKAALSSAKAYMTSAAAH